MQVSRQLSKYMNPKEAALSLSELLPKVRTMSPGFFCNEMQLLIQNQA